MTVELLFGYAGYLVWLAAGLGDFVRHWRTDLPHTSGLAESVAHLVQLAVLALAVVVAIAFEIGRGIAVFLFVLVVLHAIVGYVDTRIAFRRHRVVSPVEQHLHSVLDMAPIIAFAWVLISAWPTPIESGWRPQLRSPAPTGLQWLAVLLPAAVLSVVPALLEFRAARKVALAT